MKNNLGTIVKRKNHACLRVPQKNPERDGDDYAYSLLLLYYPWRVESELVHGFESATESLKAKMEFLQLLDTHDEFAQSVVNAMRVLESCELDRDVVGMNLAPATHQPGTDRGISDSLLDPEGLDNVDNDFTAVDESVNAQKAMLVPLWSDHKFTEIVKSLNTEQSNLFAFLRSHYKESVDSVMSGGTMPMPTPLRLCHWRGRLW